MKSRPRAPKVELQAVDGTVNRQAIFLDASVQCIIGAMEGGSVTARSQPIAVAINLDDPNSIAMAVKAMQLQREQLQATLDAGEPLPVAS